MIVQMIRTDTIANNLANSDTTGFKKDLSVFQSNQATDIYRVQNQVTPLVPRELQTASYVGKLSNGAEFVRNYVDFSQGALRQTGNNLDLAITGPDFFAVQTPAGIFYTRDGSFQELPNGQLTNINGYPILNSKNKPIIVPEGDVTVDRDGNVLAHGQIVDQIQRVTLPETASIQKVGENLYRYSLQPGPPKGEVHQGFLEASNSNPIMEMVRLIEAQRAYEASSKALQSQDAAIELAVSSVGKSSGF